MDKECNKKMVDKTNHIQRVSPNFEDLVKKIRKQLIMDGADIKETSFKRITERLAMMGDDILNNLSKNDKDLLEGLKKEKRKF